MPHPRLAPLAAVLTGLALLVGCAGSAHASWRIDRATAIARVVWHHPCVDRMQIRWQSFAGLEPRLADSLAFATPDTCTVYLDTRRHLTWGDVCYELLHEAGHLAGYRHPVGVEPFDQPGPRDHDHSPDPRSIMYPSPTLIENNGHIAEEANWRCRDRGRPFLTELTTRLPRWGRSRTAGSRTAVR